MNASVAVLLALGLIFTAPPPARSPHAHGTAPAASAAAAPPDDLEMLKGLSLDQVRREGKAREIPPGAVELAPEVGRRIGIRFGTVETRPLQKTIRTVGRIEADERRIAVVSPRIGGWVEALHADFTGRFVRRGEPLLSLYSPDLVAAQEEYLLALRVERDGRRSPFPEVAETGRELAAAARRRLLLWGVSEPEIRRLEERGRAETAIPLRSPFEGYVLEKRVARGQFVEAGTQLFQIVDLSVVWLIAEVYENDLPMVRPGQEAVVRLSATPGERFTARAAYVDPTLDPRTRTVRVRYEFPNPRRLLKPGMFTEVEIAVSLGRRLAVPESAVIDSGLRRIVLVEAAEGFLEPREVRLGARAGEYFEVLEGLAAGERVVTSANFLIDSESRLREALGGGHPH